MTVPLLDLTRQYCQIKDEVKPVVDSIMESQRFVNGPIVREFEQNFAKFCGTNFAIGCSSGTDALLMSLTALDIGCEHEVITVPFTFFATVEVIIRRGASPVFVDIDKDCFTMNVEQIEAAITKKTKAIIPVHLFGQCANMDEIKKIAKKYNLLVIEDSAQAVGSTWEQSRAGSMGDVGCFSFFPSKNLGAFGDGGMVTTNSEALYEKMLRTRQHGIDMKNPYYYDHLGGNFRLDALQAGVLNVKLKYIEEWQAKRRKNAEYYNQHINNNNIIKPFSDSRSYHVYNQYVIRTENRDELKKQLISNNIGCSIYYPYPIHLQPCISMLNYHLGDFPVTEKACEQVLALPIFPELTIAELDMVIEVINQ